MSISSASSQVATLTRFRFVASGAVSSVSSVDANGNVLAYTVGSEQVYKNGALLVRGTQYTATNGTSISFTSALALNDVVEIIAFSPFTITNAVDQTLVTAKGDIIVATAGNTVTNVAIGSALQSLVPDSSEASGVRWGDDLLVLQVMQAI